MAIPLTAAQTTAIGEDVRKPRYMVEIILGVQTIRLSTGESFIWEANNYLKSGVSVADVKTGKGGIQSCRITVIDDGFAYSELVVSVGFVFRSVKCWKVYGDPPYAADDPILEFVGEIVAIPNMGKTITFDCATKNGLTRRSPGITLGPPNIKHLPYPGQKVVIGNELYIVESK